MFTKQAPVFRQQLEQAGFSTEQANAMVSMIGQCMSSLEHRGPVSFTGPVSFAQMQGWVALESSSLLNFKTILRLASSSFSQGCNVVVVSRWHSQRRRREIDVWPGPFINASESEFIQEGQALA